MNVSVTIPTRGDVELQPIIDSFPPSWEIVIWDNGARMVTRSDGWAEVCQDLSVYGRYAAIEYCSHDLILTQDDDVIVSDPQAIVDAWKWVAGAWTEEDREPPYPLQAQFYLHPNEGGAVVANMPQEFRHDGYVDSCLVGFGACFHRDLWNMAFGKFGQGIGVDRMFSMLKGKERDFFLRTCDVVFTTLTPRVLVDVARNNLPYATDASRMYRQPDHISERARMLDLARRVRDAG